MKLVVIGGVAAGASLAARARRLDEQAEIVVLERGHHVSFANCGLPYHIGEVIADRDRLILQTPQSLRELLNLDIRIGAEVTAINRTEKFVTVRDTATGHEYTESYDTLGLCPGSAPLVPPLSGIDHPSVHVLRRLGDMDRIKAQLDAAINKAPSPKDVRAVVIGAGYIGLEMAENLHHRGATVDIVELSDQILPPVDREISVPVERHLRSRGIQVHLSTAAAAITPGAQDRVTVELANGEFLDADLVLLAAGVRPSAELAVAAGLDLGPRGGVAVDAHMRTSDPSIWAAGDVVETAHPVLPGTYLMPLAGPANRQARVAAENIMGRETKYQSTQGTSIVKVFDMVAGGTGATERQLIAASIPYRAAHIHATGHAGYYPGTAMMQLKVLFDPERGTILGAQASGFDGVDKRLDVLAAALRAGLTVYDLEELELAYAPPFGSAKDPVNMVGFVGANVLRGDLTLCYPEDLKALPENARILDVRTAAEYAIWHLPGAESTPLSEFRDQLDGWDRDTPIRLYCAVGFRAYLAYRILAQHGFTDIASLSGGSTTYRAWHDAPASEFELPAPVIGYTDAAAARSFTPQANIEIDCTGLACPGPILKLTESMKALTPGDEITVTVSDPGFRLDGPAWASSNGHDLLEMTPQGAGYLARFRKSGAALHSNDPRETGLVNRPNTPGKTSFVVFSGELDKVLAAFIIANGALAMGTEVSMFFTFWGLNALRREDPPKREKSAMERAFAAMLPSGPQSLPLSNMNMLGAGRSMIKKVMKQHDVSTLPELIATAQAGGARLIGCTMTMDLLGISQSDLIDGVELGGVATFLSEAQGSGTTLFI